MFSRNAAPVTAAGILATFTLAFSPALLAQSKTRPDATLSGVRHVIGLEKVELQKKGRLSLQNGSLLFEAGSTHARIPVSSINDVFIGSETTQSNSKGGRTLQYVALVAPYYSGRALSVLTRTQIDVLTVLYRDGNNGLHSAVLSLPKDSAAELRMKLIAAGAHDSEPVPSQPLPPPNTQQQPPTAKQHVQAILIEPVEAGNISIPAEFRYAMYERLVERVSHDGKFQKVFRSGDSEAAGIPDLAVLRTTVSRFKEGGETKREVTMVAGGTVVDVNATVTRRDGSVLMNDNVQGRVLYFGENLGVANDVSKRVEKLLQKHF